MGLFRRKPIPVKIIFDSVEFKNIADKAELITFQLNEAAENMRKASKESADRLNKAVKSANNASARLEAASRKVTPRLPRSNT